MRSLVRIRNGNKKKSSKAVKIPSRREVCSMDISSKVEFIRSLIPLGLMAISEELDRKLIYLTGEKVVLGFIQSSTENEKAISNLFKPLCFLTFPYLQSFRFSLFLPTLPPHSGLTIKML